MIKLINFLKWFFAFAVFGVATYAIYQGYKYLKGKAGAVSDALKPSQYKKGAEQTTFEKYFPNIAEVKDKAMEYFTRNPINPVVPIVTDIIDKVKSPLQVSPDKTFVTDTKAQGAVQTKVAENLKLVPKEHETVLDKVMDFFTPEPEKRPLGVSYYVPKVKKGALGVSEKKNIETLADLSGKVGQGAKVKISPAVFKRSPAVSTTFKPNRE